MPNPATLPTAGVLALALVLGLAGGVGGALATSAITSANADVTAPDASATPGPAGGPGAPGPRGDAGRDGEDGLDGASGPAGARGPAGPAGPAGFIGAAGADGASGADGADGASGADGAAGQQGPVGPAGQQGLQGVPGIQGLTGPIGPAGPAGASGIGAAAQYTVFSAQDRFSTGHNTFTFTQEHSSSVTAATVTGGSVVLSAAGAYRITYVATPKAENAATTSVGSAAVAAYALQRNGVDVPGSVVQRPMFDVNVALVLTLRTMIQGGSYTATSYVAGQAGDIIDVVFDTDFTVREGDTGVQLLVERLG